MTEVKFKQDYRGKLTGEVFYSEGDKTSLPPGVADELAERGIVEKVKLTKTVTKPRHTRKKKA